MKNRPLTRFQTPVVAAASLATVVLLNSCAFRPEPTVPGYGYDRIGAPPIFVREQLVVQPVYAK